LLFQLICYACLLVLDYLDTKGKEAEVQINAYNEFVSVR